MEDKIHNAMLTKSSNAKDVGELTVVLLGNAVSIAKDLIAQAREEERDKCHIEINGLKTALAESQNNVGELKTWLNNAKLEIRVSREEEGRYIASQIWGYTSTYFDEKEQVLAPQPLGDLNDDHGLSVGEAINSVIESRYGSEGREEGKENGN